MLTIQEIKNYRVFSGLTENELAEIARLCVRRYFDSNAIIFEPDTPSEDIFILEEGNDAVQIEVPLGFSEGKIAIHTLSKGETFGWAPLGTRSFKIATARCLDRVSVIAINGKQLINLCERTNHIGYIVMRNLFDIINTRLSYTTIVFRYEIRKLKKAVTA
jgi:CRP/FNR family transcriptional regulator, cyclic AMP receptor protein